MVHSLAEACPWLEADKKVVRNPNPGHFSEGKVNLAEILSLSSGRTFDLIKKAGVKDLMGARLQLGKKKSKKRAVIDIFTA